MTSAITDVRRETAGASNPGGAEEIVIVVLLVFELFLDVVVTLA